MLQIPTTYYLLPITYCSLQAGLLMLQIPTGRRPRPFSPSVLVPLPEVSSQYVGKHGRYHTLLTDEYLPSTLPSTLLTYLLPPPEALRGRAVVYLREDLGFVCESGLDARAGWEAGGGRWMHELGVAFARLDPKGRTPPSWNCLQPLAAPSQPLTATLTAPHGPSRPLTAPQAAGSCGAPTGCSRAWQRVTTRSICSTASAPSAMPSR